MSQVTAGARLAPRPQRGASVPGSALRVIRGTVDRPRGGVFAAICLALLVGGFLLVLVLNTSMAKGSFVLDDLQARSGALADQQSSLEASIDAQSAPAALAQRAMKLGMVPSTTAAFLNLADGRVLGVAKAAQKVPGFTVITSPTPVPPKKTVTKTVTRKGTVTTTTVVTKKAKGVVRTVATSLDAEDGHTVVRTTVVTPQPPNTVKTVATTVDSATKQTTVTTTVVATVGTKKTSTTTTTTKPSSAATKPPSKPTTRTGPATTPTAGPKPTTAAGPTPAPTTSR